RRADRGWNVTAALLAGALRDLPPVLDAPLGALHVELHDAEFRVHGDDRAGAELGRLLHDQIHRVGLRQCLDERELETRVDQRVERRAQLELGAATLKVADARPALGAEAVERDELIAALEPQHVTEVVSFALVERKLVAAQVAIEE